ncbi:uncharacterized protein LOC128892183 [Hylaeus anthracinus]|uniref:uncharacterized protein LOC128892183 n=1 Tax=Hylaeus anthracinus TaxID=313031 RepID=UPI0023B94584|nr:uncharacterized protein LOC128892183 [Hylaeus anthracinus]
MLFGHSVIELLHGGVNSESEIKMPIDFYGIPGSSPCRAVALTAAALGVPLNYKEVNLMAGEHMKPEFLKINPDHTVPTIDDNGFRLWESRAIMTYLAEQYGKDDSLYPKDPKKRAVVNRVLYYDACTLYKAFSDYYYPIIFAKAPKDQDKYEAMGKALSSLETALQGQDYVAGKNMTLADLALLATISTFEAMNYDFSPYKNVMRWYAKAKSEAPKYEECNDKGVKAFKTMVESMMKKSIARIMSVDLYYTPMSAPCRAILLTAEAIGLPLNLKEIDLMAGEHLAPEFVEMNPQHTVPFLVDDDYKISESRAIMAYLVDQYGKNPRLYPQTPSERALVNQRLYFDIGTMYKAVKEYYYPVVFGKTTDFDPEKYKMLQAAYEILNTFLEGQDYVTGRNLTIADLSLVATISTTEMLDFEIDNYPNVAKWLEKTKSSAPGYRKANGEGVQIWKTLLENLKQE